MTSLDELMGFDPSNLTIFNEPSSTNTDERIYSTQPKLSKSEDGAYRSRIRLLFNPFDFKQSIIKVQTYWVQDENGGITVPSSLSIGDRSCPIFTGWKKLWYVGEEGSQERKESQDYARKYFNNTTQNWVLVQIIEDDNQPELVGQFKFWKLPSKILTKLTAKMNPSAEVKKAPEPLMDYLFGKVLELTVTPGPDDPKDATRKNREISYDISEFEADITPIINANGSAFFAEDEMELIEQYAAAKKKILKFKPENRPAEIQKLAESELTGKIKELYAKAIEFMKTAPDVSDMGYKPWSEELTTRVQAWVDKVVSRINPTSKPSEAESIFNQSPNSTGMDMMDMMGTPIDDKEDDLPF